LIRSLASSWLLLLVGLTAGPAPRAQDAFVIEPIRVSKSAWYVRGESGVASRENRGFMSNAGFVVTDEGVVVFDALATPALAQALLATIRAQTDRPIRRVIVSHYHADHIYGLQVFKAAGAEIWAREEGLEYLGSDAARDRLAQRRRDLSPWVDAGTHLVPADHWIRMERGQSLAFTLGGTRFELIDGGDSHSRGDLMLWMPTERVLFAGDLFFTRRLPFVVDGNSRQWLGALERMERVDAAVVIPGHGPASSDVQADLVTTREYLRFLREQMGQAVDALESFEAAYAAVDWSRFSGLATFDQANRRNAHSVYLEMQAEMLRGAAAAQP
jgi:glyoxylase-like metal-dependent hydrolase (beta-lactamase superfamily II)